MNANFNTYYKNTRTDSDSIRRAYLARTRKESASGVIDSTVIWYVIFSLKIACGIASAIGFFAILGMIDSGALSPFSGIFCTVLAALLECLCFVPIGQRPTAKKNIK